MRSGHPDLLALESWLVALLNALSHSEHNSSRRQFRIQCYLILRYAKDIAYSLLSLACSSCRKAKDGSVPQVVTVLEHVPQPEERWTEVVPPLCHAVHFINAYETAQSVHSGQPSTKAATVGELISETAWDTNLKGGSVDNISRSAGLRSRSGEMKRTLIRPAAAASRVC